MKDDYGHGELIALLDPFIDGELDAETSARIAAHVDVCASCARRVVLHRRLRARFNAQSPDVTTHDLHARILARLRVPDPGTRVQLAAWSGWLLAAVLALGWVTQALFPGRVPIPMVQAAVTDFNRHAAHALPQPNLVALRAHVPFPVAPLPTLSRQLLASWSTVIRGTRAAAIAYRVRDRVVVQYIVNQRIFFEQPAVRRAIARNGRYVARDGRFNVVAWPQSHSGVLLVGDIDPGVLAGLHM